MDVNASWKNGRPSFTFIPVHSRLNSTRLITKCSAFAVYTGTKLKFL